MLAEISLDEMTLEELFKLQREVGYAIERKLK